MMPLLLYHDFTSPFCRLAFDRVRSAAEEAAIPLELVPFELRPGTHPLTRADADAVAAELEAAAPLAREWGIALTAPRRIPRTAKAHEAIAFAAREGRAVALAAAIYHAYWSGGADIGRIDVLAGIGEQAGVDQQALHLALGLDQYRDAVARAQREAEAAGVEAVPLLRRGERWVAGVLDAEEMRAWLAAEG